MTEQQQTTVLGTVSVSVTFPAFGPADTEAGKDALVTAFEASWNVWYTDCWHADFKDIFFYPPSAETAEEMRTKLDRRMAAALPQLRAVLKKFRGSG